MTITRRVAIAAGGVAVAAVALVTATQVGAGADTKPLTIPAVVEKAELPAAEAPAVPDVEAYVPAPEAGTFDLTAPTG